MDPLLAEEDLDPTQDLNAKLNGKALRIIRSSLSNEVLPFVANCKTAKETWATLKSFYGSVDKQAQQMLFQKFFRLQPLSGELSSVYVSRVQAMVNELNNNPVNPG
jgi:hypothetical protein